MIDSGRQSGESCPVGPEYSPSHSRPEIRSCLGDESKRVESGFCIVEGVLFFQTEVVEIFIQVANEAVGNDDSRLGIFMNVLTGLWLW